MNDALKGRNQRAAETQRAGKVPATDGVAASAEHYPVPGKALRLVNQEHLDIDAHSTQVRRITELLCSMNAGLIHRYRY